MPTYIYKAATDTGLIVRNRVEAPSKQNLLRALKDNDLMPITIEQVAYSSRRKKTKKKNIKDIDEIMKNVNTTQINTKKTSTVKEKINMYLSKTEKVTNRDLVIFTQNFYLLKKANFNNIHALKTIIDSTENITFKGVLEDILAGVEAGENMYTTMEYYSDIFPYIYVNMIKVGELSGSLTNSLQQAVEYLDSTEKLNNKIKGIIVPNITLFIGVIVTLIGSMIYLVPTIQDVYDQMGAKETLPKITLWLQSVLKWQGQYWYIPLSVIGIIAAIIAFYVNTPKGKYNFDYFKYKMPVFGKLIFALDFSRFLKAMLLNLQNGMRIQDSMEVAKNVVQNYVLLSVIETSLNNIIIGESWVEPFEKSGLARPMITEMLKIGMQTDLTEMMEKLVEYMDMDIDNELQKIVKALPDITYAIVGVALIFLILAVIAPAVQMYMGGWVFDAAGV